MAQQFGPGTASGAVRPAAGGATAMSAGASVAAGGAGGEEIVPFVSQVPGTPVHFPSFHGRAISWISVSLIMVAFVIGGLALVFGPTWWLFWASVGLAGLGTLMALAVGIFDDWY
ncbi:MAG TPA: hypothetical protein VMA32_05310 [Streptosporangiaceae bacterium]|nr:hypothetical protein [Streptosporangiaceae bacterium]